MVNLSAEKEEEDLDIIVLTVGPPLLALESKCITLFSGDGVLFC